MSIVELTEDTTPGIGEPSANDPSESPSGDWDVSEVTADLRDPPEALRSSGPPNVVMPDRQAVGAVPRDVAPSDGDRRAVTGTRPTFTITDAATACAVSRKTITRKLADLAEHGAAKDEDGVWRIPVEALLAVGLHPGRSVPATRPRSSPAARASETTTQAPAGQDRGRPGQSLRQLQSSDSVTIPRDRWDDLRLRLARAEAEAAERALALADARLALRALTAAPFSPPAAAELTGPQTAQPALVAQVAPAQSQGMGQGVPPVPPAAGWVMSAQAGPSEGVTGPLVVPDPGLAPPVTGFPPQPRKRRWWQSSAR